MMKRQIFIFVLLGTHCFLHAATGPAVLRLGGSARSTGLHEAVTAAAGDLDGLFYNPAGLAGLTRREVSATHGELLLGDRLNIVEVGQPFQRGGMAVGITHLVSDDIGGRDAEGHPTGDFNAQDIVGTVGYAHALRRDIGVGINVKYIDSRIASERASTAALDLGVVVQLPGRPLWLAAAVTNMGPSLKYGEQKTALPMTFSIGGAAELFSTVKLLADVKREPRNHMTEFSTGFEISVIPQLALRSGALSQFGSPEEAHLSASNLRGGVGLYLNSFRIDYALAPFDDLGVVHRFSFSAPF